MGTSIYEDEEHSSSKQRGSLVDRVDVEPTATGEEEDRAGGSQSGPIGSRLRTGPLLRKKGRDAARYNLRLWEDQRDLYTLDMAQWDVNDLRRKGVPNVQLRKEEGRSAWRAWYPPGSSRGGADGMNKAATLCRRTISVLFADPPVADPVPASGSAEDQGATEFAANALQELQGETALNTVTKARRAMDRACTSGVQYTHTLVDPYGSLEPVRIEAHPLAETVDDATLDPTTGIDGLGPFLLRFVRPDGTLTDTESEAAREWHPTLRKDILHPRNVRLHPHTAEDLWEAEGATIAIMTPWRDVKRMFRQARDLKDETIAAITSFRPQHAPELLDRGKGKKILDETQRVDDHLVLVVTTYYKSCADYPDGCHVTTIADQLCVVQETLVDESDGARRVRDIPLSAYMQFDDGQSGPTRSGLMEFLGPGNDTRQTMLGLILDSLEAAQRRKIFLPTSSVINPRDLQLPSKTVLPINPGGQPHYEELPKMPEGAFDLVHVLSQELDSDSGLQQAGQGLESPSVTSGEQAKTILAQVHAGLSDLRANAVRGYLRDCRIELQLARAYFDKPRRIEWEGEDGRHNERWWSGADLASTQDVRLKTGSMTMLDPVVKADLAVQYGQMGFLDPDELQQILASNMGGTLGIRDNPFRKRIKRQIADWLEGPPEGWQPAVIQAVDPTTGAPVAQFDPLQDPTLQAIWRSVPADQLPRAAQLRLGELARLQCTERYAAANEYWRAGVDAEFLLAQMAVQAAAQAAQMQPGGAPSPTET